MPNWKKVIISGSDAALGDITCESLDVNGNIELSETAATTDTDKFAVLDSGVIKFRTGAQVLSDIGGGSGTVTSVGGTGTVSGLTLTGTVTTSGNLTLGGSLSLTSGQITTGLGFTPYNATNPSGYTTNTGTVTGTGTINYLPKFTPNTSTLGNSLIFDNGTNVGIGTATPGAKLEVNGTIKTTNNNLSFTGTSLYAGNTPATGFDYDPADGISSITDASIKTEWAGEYIYNGQTIEGLSSAEDITKGMLVYMLTNGRWGVADAAENGKSTPLLGIALDTVTSGNTLAVLLDGIIITTEHTQNTTATAGLPLYIETSGVGTAGDVTEEPPADGGNIVRLIGHNIHDTDEGVIIRFQPDNTWIELE